MQTAAANSAAQRNRSWTGTPEVYFHKAIDNSRLVKVEDPAHAREMRMLMLSLGCLFLFVMTYAVQHFKSIEYGYKIASLKNQRDSLSDTNRALQLQEASLRDPQRIDNIARKLGFQSPQAGQIMHLDAPMADSGSAEMASAAPVSVISAR
jgi:cell division protein FtsL